MRILFSSKSRSTCLAFNNKNVRKVESVSRVREKDKKEGKWDIFVKMTQGDSLCEAGTVKDDRVKKDSLPRMKATSKERRQTGLKPFRRRTVPIWLLHKMWTVSEATKESALEALRTPSINPQRSPYKTLRKSYRSPHRALRKPSRNP